MKFIKDTSYNLANETRRASDLLVAFHSRLAQKAFAKPWEQTAPTRFYKIGHVERTDYRSDKDDPETRAPRLRANDPEGVQGIWKYFTHRHESGVGLYTTRPNYFQLQRDNGFGGAVAPPSECVEVEWPSIMTYLNEVVKFDVLLPDGRVKPLEPKGLQLWSFPDTHTLVAIRPPSKYNSAGQEVYVLHGGDLCVTWRGIQY